MLSSSHTMYSPSTYTPLHRAASPPPHLTKLTQTPPNYTSNPFYKKTGIRTICTIYFASAVYIRSYVPFTIYWWYVTEAWACCCSAVHTRDHLSLRTFTYIIASSPLARCHLSPCSQRILLGRPWPSNSLNPLSSTHPDMAVSSSRVAWHRSSSLFACCIC